MAAGVKAGLDVLDGGASLLALATGNAALIPVIGASFKIAKGVVDFISFINKRDQPDPTIEMLKGIQAVIEKLTLQSAHLASGLGVLLRGDQSFRKIEHYVERYSQSRDNQELIDWIRNPGDGLDFHMSNLEKMILTPSVLSPDHESWIKFLCRMCLDNATDDDLTGGFKAACQRFAAVLALQRSAIIVLKELQLPIDVHLQKIDAQIDLFFSEFEMQWNARVGEMKKVVLKDRVCTIGWKSGGDVKNNRFYMIKFITQIFFLSQDQTAYPVMIDLATGSGYCFGKNIRGDATMSLEKGKVVACKGKVYSVQCGKILRMDQTNEAHTMCDSRKFHSRSQMVCHEGFLYAISSEGELCKINLENEHLEVISTGWSTSTYGSTALAAIEGNPLIYAISKGSINESFYEINPKTNSTKELSHGHSFTRMAMTGHGEHLYAINRRTVGAYNLTDKSYRTIQKGTVEYARKIGSSKRVHLMNDGYWIYVQYERPIYGAYNKHDYDELVVYRLRPYWVQPK